MGDDDMDVINKTLRLALASTREEDVIAALLGMHRKLISCGLSFDKVVLVRTDLDPSYDYIAIRNALDELRDRYDALWERTKRAEREARFYKKYLSSAVIQCFTEDDGAGLTD